MKRRFLTKRKLSAVRFIFAVTAVTALQMWYCPYCEQTGTRRWNLSTHIQRKHPGRYNPLPEMKQVRPFNTYSSQAKPQSANSFLPQDDLSAPAQIFEKSTKFQNLLHEIKQLNKMEINFLLIAISNLPNYRNYTNSLF